MVKPRDVSWILQGFRKFLFGGVSLMDKKFDNRSYL
jgi:hypothetical protein